MSNSESKREIQTTAHAHGTCCGCINITEDVEKEEWILFCNECDEVLGVGKLDWPPLKTEGSAL